ncbi:MAG: hypothetical protein IBJ16_06230 [Chitinophagaceae bacterium]|nr:hypothetical protein [Chitinophagaceae bacterium]
MSHDLRALNGDHCRPITIHFINSRAYEWYFLLYSSKAALSISKTGYSILHSIDKSSWFMA